MPKLIVVHGISNSGKTSSILEFLKTHRGVTASPFPSVITLPIQKGGRWLLGVAKDGDTAFHVANALSLVATHGCDIVVCSTKSSGVSVATLNAFITATPHISVVRIASHWASTPTARSAANASVAAMIERNIP